MRLKKTVLLYILLFSCGLPGIYAQEAVVSGGGDATGTGSVSYSMGQVFYETYSGPTGTVAQGVQHAYEISSTAGVTPYEPITLEFEIYPNPTTDYLTLDASGFALGELNYVLYDINGRVLAKKDLTQTKTIIEMINFPQSTYFLKVSDETNIVKTFKIIKN
jgi:hypothetical protein